MSIRVKVTQSDIDCNYRHPLARAMYRMSQFASAESIKVGMGSVIVDYGYRTKLYWLTQSAANWLDDLSLGYDVKPRTISLCCS